MKINRVTTLLGIGYLPEFNAELNEYLSLKLMVKNNTISVTILGKSIFQQTDSTIAETKQIKREFSFPGDLDSIQELIKIGKSLKACRTTAFYSDEIFKKEVALDFVNQLEKSIAALQILASIS
jgi:hypothetical protein